MVFPRYVTRYASTAALTAILSMSLIACEKKGSIKASGSGNTSAEDPTQPEDVPDLSSDADTEVAPVKEISKIANGKAVTAGAIAAPFQLKAKSSPSEQEGPKTRTVRVKVQGEMKTPENYYLIVTRQSDNVADLVQYVLPSESLAFEKINADTFVVVIKTQELNAIFVLGDRNKAEPPASIPVAEPVPPSVVAGSLVAYASSTSEIKVTWTSGGGSTAKFLVAKAEGYTPPASCKDGKDVSFDPSKNQVDTTFGDLKAGTVYSFSVCAVNAGAITAYSSVSSTAAKTMNAGSNQGGGQQLPAPVVSSVSIGTYTIGTALNLQVTGSNFVSGATIKIGSAACVTTFTSSTQLICSSADVTAGTHGITVINPDNQFHTLASSLVVSQPARVLSISSVEPTSAYTAGGGLLKVNGGGFATGTTVSIGGTACGSVVIASPSVLFCTIPAKSAQIYDVTLNDVSAGSANLAGAFTYQILPAGGGSSLQVSAVNPNSISSAGGTSIFISGDAFTAGATVNIGGTPCTSVNLVNTTTLYCTAPAKAAGSYNVVVTLASSETATLTNGLTYTSTPSTPVVSSVSPSTGSAGQTIMISGQHFDTDATVTVGGQACANVVRVNSSTLTCAAPALAAGTYHVQVTNPQSSLDNTLNNAFTIVSVPTVSSVSPDVSMLAGGATITISGSGFAAGATVAVGGTPCTSPNVANATTMTCVLPAKTGGVHHLAVTNTDTGTATLLNAVRYFAAPSVSSIVPTSGELAGGNPLTITGSGFLSGATVTVGGNACTPVTFLSSTSLYCIVPAGSAGAANVVVTNPGSQTGTLTNGYTYNAPIIPPRSLAVSAVEPASISVSGGSLLKISGTDFETGMTVTVGGDNCTNVVLASSSMLFCSAPAKTAATYSIGITDSESTTVSLTNSLTYVADAPPAAGLDLVSVTPTSVSTSAQSTIFLNGTGFVSGSTVTVGGTACTPAVFVNDTTVYCTAPTKTAGTYDIVITLPDTEQDTLAAALTYSSTPVNPTISSVIPTSGAAGQTLTVSGQNFDSDATVTVGGQNCSAPVWINSATVTCTIPALAAGPHNVVVTNPQSSLTGTLSSGFTTVSVPEISSVEPNAAMLGGAITATIHGSGFAAGASVAIGGTACTAVNVVNATTITCTLPARSAGFHSVSVTNSNGGSGSLPNAVRYYASPAISSVVPSSGNVAGGNPITITGNGFVSGITVAVGASACTPVTFVNSSLIYCIAPSGSAGAVNVSVENATGETASASNAYTYTGSSNAPTISGISPLQGGTGGGGTLTVTGSDFASDAVVTIGGTNCSDINVVSSSAITCTIPAKIAGTFDIGVTNVGTGLSGALTQAFTYVSAPTVLSVTPPYMGLSGGTTVTISGTGFVAGSTVKFGVASCSSVTINSSNMLTCSAPALTAGTYNVSVVRPDGIAGYLNNAMTYRGSPTFTSVSPNQGTINGGNLATISGTNFFGVPAVKFGTNVCGNVNVQSSTTLTCVTPAGTAGTVNIEITNMDGQSVTSTNAFTYQTPAFDAGQSSLFVSATRAPHDNQAEVTVTVVPRDDQGVKLGAGKQVEISATGTVTLAGAAECAVTSAGCKRAVDNGNGAYTITAKTSTAGTVTFSAVITSPSVQAISATAQTTFNTALFTTISATTTLTSASHAGLDLLITGGTITIDNAAIGLTLGNVFIRGGTFTHNASTTTNVYKMDINVASLHMYGSAILNLNGKGYPQNYTWSASGAVWNGNAGSHGGRGSSTSSYTYGDLRDPSLPGSNFGGGILRLKATNGCNVSGTSRITANGSSFGSGGSIYMRCGSYSGNSTSNPAVSTTGSSGGGGRIALTSPGDRSVYAGIFTYPVSAGTLNSFKTKVSSGGTSTGGAGTVYLSTSESIDGDLIIDNYNANPATTSGTTRLLSFEGTVLSTPSSTKINVNQITAGDALSPSTADIYKGIRVRPTISQDNGTPNNPLDDQILTISSHDNLSFTFSSNHTGVSPGDTFRSIEIFDHLHIGGGAILESNGDVYARYGDLALPGTSVLSAQDASMKFNAGVYNYPGYTNKIDYTFSALSSAVFSDLPSLNNLTVSGGIVTITAPINPSSVSVSNGSITLQGASNTIQNLTMSGNGTLTTTGSLHAPTIGLSGNSVLTVGTTLSTNGSLSIPDSVQVNATTLSLPGDLNIFSTRNPSLNVEEINAVNLSMSAGYLTHNPSTSILEKRLTINLSGQFLISGSSTLSLQGKGYPQNYTWGPTAPIWNGNAGSHGGRGSSSAGHTYGNFRNPSHPGSNQGGGVLRLNATSGCVINDTARILANGQSFGSGGSVYLNCASFSGNTSSTPAISANGSSGGGGRIALISKGNHSTFSGSFAYPTNSLSLSAFKNRVRAQGTGTGAAGTIYLQSTDSTDGDLIIDNNNSDTATTSGTTRLISFQGTVLSTPTANKINVNQITSGEALSVNTIDLYKGIRFRPDISQNNGTPGDLLDDQIVTVQSNDSLSFTLTGNHSGIAPGAVFRSIEILDHLHVGGGAMLESLGDLYSRHGDIVNPESAVLALQDSWIKVNNGSYSYPNYSNMIDYTFSGLPSSTLPDLPNLRNLAISGGSLTVTGTVNPGSLVLTNGSLTLQGVATTVNSLNASGSSTLATTGALNASSLTMAGNATISVGTTLTTSNDITIPGTSQLNATIITTPGDINIQSTRNPSVSTEQLNAVNMSMTSGYLTHPASTTSSEKKLEINLSGQLLMSGNAYLNLNGKGYPQNYTWSATGPIWNGAAGSYGGRGSSTSSPTYGDFRNPSHPGSNQGGGVLRVTASNGCILNDTARIIANGQSFGSGGTIYMKCASFSGNSSTSPAISATGSSGGGGRVALISTGDKSTFTGFFSYPTNNVTLNDFKAKVKANGTGTGGAGTIYLHTSVATDGDLIVDNNNTNAATTSGTSRLLSFQGTVLTTPTANKINVNQITAGDALSTATANLYKGIRVRPNISLDNGTPNDILDDQILVVDSHDALSFTFSSNYSGVTAGSVFRSIEILDHLHVGGGAILESNGDIYSRHGDLADPGTAVLTLRDALIKVNAGSYNYPGYTNINNYVFSGLSGSTLPDLYSVQNVSVTAGSVTIPTNVTLNNLTQTGGSISLQGGSNTITSLSMSGDAVLNASGSLIVPSLTLADNASLNAAAALTVGNDINIPGTAQVTAATITTAGDINILSTKNPALLAEQVNAVNMSMTSGTMSHNPSTTVDIKRLVINLSGQFQMSGNAHVNLYAKGYPQNYTWSSSGAVWNGAAGSHGGRGSNTASATYGDFRNPDLPGSNQGGGVFRLTAANGCSINDTARISASGASFGAGGSIYLHCASFAGNSTSNPVISATGASGAGGRIALISSSNKASFSGVLTYPTDSTSMNDFKSKVKANGSGTGAAGTIYLASNASVNGDLIIDNNGNSVSGTSGNTDFLSTTANSSILHSSSGNNTAQIAASGTPLTGKIDLYKGTKINLYEISTPQPADPLGGGVIQTMTLTANNTNSFTASANFPTISADHYYRFFYRLDHLHVSGNAQVNMDGADLIIEECDWQDLGTSFVVPAGSKITGNALASDRCTDAGVSTKGSTVVFTGYFLQ